MAVEGGNDRTVIKINKGIIDNSLEMFEATTKMRVFITEQQGLYQTLQKHKGEAEAEFVPEISAYAIEQMALMIEYYESLSNSLMEIVEIMFAEDSAIASQLQDNYYSGIGQVITTEYPKSAPMNQALEEMLSGGTTE
ncbi:MAG: hypothetical protein ACK5LC_01980 [Coprobacillaceae bacterium]